MAEQTKVDIAPTPNIFYMDVDLWIGNITGTARKLKFFEPNSVINYTGANFSSFRAQAQAANIEYILPASGSAGEVLSIASVGGDDYTLDWITAGTGNVTTALNITDNSIVRGDGGGVGIQESLGFIDDSGNVTGFVAQTNTGLLTVTTAGNAALFQNTTDAVSNQAARFGGGNRATPAIGDEVYTSWYLDNSFGNQVEYARLTTKATTVTGTNQAAELVVGVMFNGTMSQRAAFGIDYFAPTSTGTGQYTIGTQSGSRWVSNVFVSTSAGLICENFLSSITLSDTYVTVAGADLKAPNVEVTNGGALRTSPIASHSMSFQVYDNDATSFVTWAAILNANNPNVDLKEAYVTMNSNVIYRVAGLDVAITDGGTGASTASGARTNLGFADGTYTPTLTNVANLDASTAYQCQYMRVGNTVTVSGKVDVDPTGATADTQLGISLPIASNFSTAQNCAGTAASPAIISQSAAILADTANDRATMQWLSGDTSNQAMYFSFTYLVQ